MLLRRVSVLYALIVCSLCTLHCSFASEQVGVPSGGPHVTLEDSKHFSQPTSQDIVLLSPQYTLEFPGTKGVMRVLTGFTILLVTIWYMAFVTYPKLMSSLQQFIMRARQVTDVLVGEVPQSPLGFLLNRVEKYAEENPEEAALQAGGLALGFVLLAWGLFSLRKPRRVRIIGV